MIVLVKISIVHFYAIVKIEIILEKYFFRIDHENIMKFVNRITLYLGRINTIYKVPLF